MGTMRYPTHDAVEKLWKDADQTVRERLCELAGLKRDIANYYWGPLSWYVREKLFEAANGPKFDPPAPQK